MFIEGDIFKIKDKEYRVRHWLEPVILRNKDMCATGGLNLMFHFPELLELEYMDETY